MIVLGNEKEDIAMRVKFWGVRGSIPTPITSEQILEKEFALVQKIVQDGGIQNLFGENPDADRIREYLESLPLSLRGTYGGDTTCVEVQAKDSPLIVLDAGSGARELGRTLIGRLFGKGNNLNQLNSFEKHNREIHFLFTHYHWDHIQGFPFFTPAFLTGDNRVSIHFYGKDNVGNKISDVLAGQQQFPNFPVIWEDMPCNSEYRELKRLDPVLLPVGISNVSYRELAHPDSVFAYRIEIAGRSFVFATDTEHKDSPDPRLIQLAKGANILYYDSQYLPEEYRGKAGTLTGALTKFDWGHSTYEWAVKNALEANVGLVILGHHEPLRDDFGLEELAKRAVAFKDEQLKLPENKGKTLEVHLAYQGLECELRV